MGLGFAAVVPVRFAVVVAAGFAVVVVALGLQRQWPLQPALLNQDDPENELQPLAFVTPSVLVVTSQSFSPAHTQLPYFASQRTPFFVLMHQAL